MKREIIILNNISKFHGKGKHFRMKGLIVQVFTNSMINFDSKEILHFDKNSICTKADVTLKVYFSNFCLIQISIEVTPQTFKLNVHMFSKSLMNITSQKSK